MVTIVMGIDPGLDGGLVALGPDGRVAAADLMPTLPSGRGSGRRLDFVRLRDLLPRGPDALVVLEELQGRPGAAMGATSALTMGQNHGLLVGMLVERGVAFELVNPQRWQRVMTPGSGDPKCRSVLTCQRLLPRLCLTPGKRTKPHDGLADAALLALYGLRELLARPVGVDVP
jgi:hypothetical protein